MSEQNNLIGEVRLAKEWVNSQAVTFSELGDRLDEIEQAYRARSGEYASVPVLRPASVQKIIDDAAEEPGRDFLADLRPAS